jgi:nitroreductase
MVRSFTDEPIDDTVVTRLLDVARRAPSAGHTQGTEFLVLRGPEETARYWDGALPRDRQPTFPWPGLPAAPLLVFPMSHRDAYLQRYAEADKGWTDRDPARWPVPYWDVDAGFAAMLLLLAAVDEGLGALFFGVFEGLETLRTEFGVPPAFTPVGCVAIGHPAADRPSRSLTRGRRPIGEVVHRGRW